MSQYDTQSPVLSGALNNGVTNGREVGAFVLAEAVKFVGTYVLTYAGLLNALYLWAFHSGKSPLLLAVSAGLSAVWGIVVFVLFILFRVLFGGVPTIVTPQAQDSPVITRGAEIGAFAVAYIIVLGIIMALNALVLVQLYVALGRELAPLIGLAISLVGAVAAFALFIGLRQAMVGR